jgi:hypothetical protein
MTFFQYRAYSYSFDQNKEGKMSHSFYLNDVNALKVDSAISATGYNDITFLDGYAVPQDGLWPEGDSFVFRNNLSVRPLQINYSNSSLQIRIFAGSSIDDYRLAVKLACAIAEAQQVDLRAEDTEILSLVEFQKKHDDEWIEQHCTDMVSMLLRSRNEPDSVATIAGVHREMRIGKRLREQLSQHRDNMMDEFIQRFRKLNYIDQEDIYQGSIMVFANKSGDKKVRLATYGETVPTLLQEKKTLVALSSESDLASSDERQRTMIGLEDLASLLGDKATWLSEDLVLLPGLQGEDWQNLLEQVRPNAVNDMFDYGYVADDDPSESDTPDAGGNLDDEDISTLAYAPIAVFCVVAGADGSIDKKEAKAFQLEIIKGVATDSELMQRVMVQVIADFETMLHGFLNQEIDAKEKLKEILSILNNKLSEGESLEFKLTLFAIGKSVAEASGGFLGFGSKISKEEKQALVGLAMFFGLA